MSRSIAIYDTTLRDGTQAEEINFTTEDKLQVARKIDELGVHYIEAGWPGSNPTDRELFKAVKDYAFDATITAFGSTHSPRTTPDKDPNLTAILDAGVSAATLFGKTWDLHAREALRVPLERNVELIRDTFTYMRPKLAELFFDAEHFFDGYKENRDYALTCLRAAYDAGAEVLVLCDTNGGSMPAEIVEIVNEVRKVLPDAALGIHCHNDTEVAVANSVEAVRAGCTQVQGTLNGFGERCGNANLTSIIPNLQLKMGYECIKEDRMALLAPVSHYVTELANLRPFLRQPYVGRSAFAHKGGIHVSAVMRNPRTYEHVEPATVGNEQRVLLSDLSGRSNIMFMASRYYKDLDKNDPCVESLLAEIKERESLGYEYSTAEASFVLLFFRTMGWSKRYFELDNFRVLDQRRNTEKPFSEATVMLKVVGQDVHTAATGHGPVNALDNALRKALVGVYPSLAKMRLSDFKVRVLSGTRRDTGGTASLVRVLIESTDGTETWTTVGLSENILDASWQALADSVNYKLFKDDPQKWPSKPAEL